MASKVVACPQCGAGVEWSPASRFRPFCSERCKLMDLGAWANERYRVPVIETGPAAIPDEGSGEPRPN